MVQDQTSGANRLMAFQEICDKIVSENVFSQYVYKTLPTSNHLWVFKKQLCAQMALSGAQLQPRLILLHKSYWYMSYWYVPYWFMSYWYMPYW